MKSEGFLFLQIFSPNHSCSVLLSGHGRLSKPAPAAQFRVLIRAYSGISMACVWIDSLISYENADKRFRYWFKLNLVLNYHFKGTKLMTECIWTRRLKAIIHFKVFQMHFKGANKLFLFSWLNKLKKQTDLKGQHSVILFNIVNIWRILPPFSLQTVFWASPHY